ncbi:phosphoenolpyruvate--protein phosphotransferase [Deltaproteobacteria bacterium Smac51]|nr:phosphoenolpyruvate--protein phosphotransferase [Deltaproteobacteria bacterium Smac51]
MEVKLFSTVSGTVVPIESVADPAFAEKMMGDGLAVRPALTRQAVVSPAEAVVSNVSRTGHAVVLSVAGRFEVLIHIGIDTVNLQGDGFTAKVKNGDRVTVGQDLIEVDFGQVSHKAPSVDVITIITNLEPGDSLTKTARTQVTPKDELFTVIGGDISLSAADCEGEEISSAPVTVLNAVGIHARPALVISQIAAKYPYVRLKKGPKEVNAKSIAALMGLNAGYNDQVVIVARGPKAQEAIDEITAAIKSGLGEAVKTTAGPKKEVVTDFSHTVELKAVVASPGFVAGKIHQAKAAALDFKEKADDAAEELVIFNDSLLLSEIRLKRNIAEAEEKKQKARAEIFQAHVGILKDEEIVETARRLIAEGLSAAAAWRAAVDENAKPLENIDNPVLKERLLDFRDVERLMLLYILGLDDEAVDLPDGAILATRELAPSDLTRYRNVAGYLVAEGSATSHASIMVRNMGIPALAAAGESVLHIPEGLNIILDAGGGRAIINPAPERLEQMKLKQRQLEEIHRRNVEKTKEPAVTVDGLAIAVKGNISNAEEARRADELGAEGVGLFRTEFMFMGGTTPPEAETHRLLYQEILDAMPGGGPITFRLLDVGGDKPISYMEGLAGEENPIMGLRGVRNYPVNLEIIREQIRGLLRLTPLSRVKIMIPMVGELSEYLWVKSLLEEEKANLGVSENVELGVMVEVPSLALTAASIGRESAFFSIGTNDLSQYTLAMDRGNANLAAKLNNLHPAILKLIRMTAEGGQASGIVTAVCGAMASELISVPMLVGLGVTELSTAMNSIPDVKALIRVLDAGKCREAAAKAMNMTSAEEVEALVRREFGEHLPS